MFNITTNDIAQLRDESGAAGDLETAKAARLLAVKAFSFEVDDSLEQITIFDAGLYAGEGTYPNLEHCSVPYPENIYEAMEVVVPAIVASRLEF